MVELTRLVLDLWSSMDADQERWSVVVDEHGLIRWRSNASIPGEGRLRAAPSVLSEAIPTAIAAEWLQTSLEVRHRSAARGLLSLLNGRLLHVGLHPCSLEGAEVCWLTVAPVSSCAPPGAFDPLHRVPVGTNHTFGFLEGLSVRELEIFRLLGLGFGQSELAARLERSSRTIETHRRSLGDKLRVSSHAKLMRHALATGLPRLSDHQADLVLGARRRLGRVRTVSFFDTAFDPPRAAGPGPAIAETVRGDPDAD